MWSLDESLGFQVNRLAGAMRSAIEARLASSGLTAPQWATLMRLLERDGWPQKELGQSQGMDKATIGGVVARLEAKGLVGRAIDPDDARVHRVTLTSAGRKLARELRPLAAEVNGRATAALSRPEAAELLTLLVRARESLSG
ncbi:MAG: MarR family winged helix-turn-helix transcriptional regulator [Roseiarcus sp.]|jgi:DNA-binding MarR family transcriptional regulator